MCQREPIEGLLRSAFTTERLDAVSLITGQLAVSPDNPQLRQSRADRRYRRPDTPAHRADLHDGAQ